VINNKIEIPELNSHNFDNFLKERTVLVDFYTDWCIPCVDQQKLISEIGFSHDHLFDVASLNIDENKALAARLQVSSLPALILFDNGKEIRRFIGLQHKEILIGEIEKNINKTKHHNGTE
jgi:thioredoxin 1